MRPIQLSNQQKRHLRSLSHDLKPIVHIGKQGITEAVYEQIHQALFAHELLKIKVLESSLLKPKDCGNELAEHTQAELIQTIGKMVVLFKRHPEKPIILLPQ